MSQFPFLVIFTVSNMSQFSVAPCFQLPACRHSVLRNASRLQHVAIAFCVIFSASSMLQFSVVSSFPIPACSNSILRHGSRLRHVAILFCAIFPASSMPLFCLASCCPSSPCHNPFLRHLSRSQHVAILFCVMLSASTMPQFCLPSCCPPPACRSRLLRHVSCFRHVASPVCVIFPALNMVQFCFASCFPDELANIFDFWYKVRPNADCKTSRQNTGRMGQNAGERLLCLREKHLYTNSGKAGRILKTASGSRGDEFGARPVFVRDWPGKLWRLHTYRQKRLSPSSDPRHVATTRPLR